MSTPDRAREERRKPYLVDGMVPWPSGSTGMAAHSSPSDFTAARVRDAHRKAETEAFESGKDTQEGNRLAKEYRKKHNLD